MAKRKSSFNIKHHLNWMSMIVILIVLMILSANGELNRTTTGLLTKIAYSIIAAVSLNFVVGFLGELSLGHAGFMCIGAYLGCYVSNNLYPIISSPVVVILIAMMVGGLTAALFGLVIGLPALRLKGDYLAITTLAFGEIVRNIVKNLPFFGGANGLRTNVSASAFKPKDLYVISFIVVIVMLILLQNLIRSKHGRAITAIRDNEIAAKAMGINVTYYKLLVFVLAAFFAGVAGVLFGHRNNLVEYTAFSYNYSIEILVMVVLGGMGNITGSVIAATLITVLNSVLQDKLSGELAALKLLVYAIILIIVVLFNNAAFFRPIKEKLSPSKWFRRKHKPEKVKDDDAKWDRITTKIQMDELLSLDMKPGAYNPVRSKKEDK